MVKERRGKKRRGKIGRARAAWKKEGRVEKGKEGECNREKGKR